jgi:hypothetical protein
MTDDFDRVVSIRYERPDVAVEPLQSLEIGDMVCPDKKEIDWFRGSMNLAGAGCGNEIRIDRRHC